MAGSWDHITTDDGKFRNVTFAQLIENLGDAHEAAEECYGMVWWLADQLAAVLRTLPGNVPIPVPELIRTAQDHYRDGLRLGGTEEE